jgi:chromosomal replication initiation ATPase DnaA
MGPHVAYLSMDPGDVLEITTPAGRFNLLASELGELSIMRIDDEAGLEPFNVVLFLRKICNAHKIHIQDLLDGSQLANVVTARRAVALELRARGWSFPRIGLLLNRHHTSIMYLVDSAQGANRISTEISTGQSVETATDK